MAKNKKSSTIVIELDGYKDVDDDAKLNYWKSKYETSLNYYQEEINKYETAWQYYLGKQGISTRVGEKEVKNVRKMCFEMVESQVDSTIPLPKVTSLLGNYKRAHVMESVLANARYRLDFNTINDYNSRVTLIGGSSFFYVYWDHNARTHDSVGSLKVRTIEPKDVVPQVGIYDIDKMDYIFYKQEITKQDLMSTFGIDLTTAIDLTQANPENLTNEEIINNEIVSLIRVYYKDEYGKIGLFSWVENTIVQDVANYYARKVWRCSKCDAIKDGDKEECPACDSTDFKLADIEKEKLEIPQVVPEIMQVNPGETEMVPQVEMVEVEAPYYTPDCFPIVQWDNVSKIKSFLGVSDVEVIQDQQDDINIFMEVIREKALKGGSIMTVPDDIYVPMTNEQFKTIPVKSPADAQKFNLINSQVNMQWDMQLQELNYKIGRETIGITNSFQGREDSSALSAKAKQMQIDQVGGRLKSKRVMRDAAYSKLYTVMFKFILANADTIRYYTEETQDGKTESKIFDKRLFLEKDAHGNYYYDDEMIINIDQTSTLMQDRQQMWQIVTSDFQSGVYGEAGDWHSIKMLWKQRVKLNYPNALEMLEYATKMAEAQDASQQKAQEIQSEQIALELAMKQQDLDAKKQQVDNVSKRTEADIANNNRAEDRADYQAVIGSQDSNQSRMRGGSTNGRRTGNTSNPAMEK